MPVHYGSNKLNYFTVSATIAYLFTDSKTSFIVILYGLYILWLPDDISFVYSTQLPNAVGAAYSLKMDGKEACAVTFFGDGGSSEVK